MDETSNIPDMNDLNMATASELVDEIRRRNPRGMLIVLLEDDREEDGAVVPVVYWGGGLITALGMAEYARVNLPMIAGGW